MPGRDQPDAQRERGAADHRQRDRQRETLAIGKAHGRPEHRRQGQVKLLFDHKRPCMQERLFDRGVIEITGL